MSRVGKSPIKLPNGVQVQFDGKMVKVKGPKGSLERRVHESMNIVVKNGEALVIPRDARRQVGQFHGLTRALLNNMVVGVSQGFTKTLSLVGVGYRAAAKGKGVTLSVGYSHPVDFDAPAGIELKVDKQTFVIVSGADREMVGQIAAKIRGVKPPEPYHGKGIRYADEVIAIKEGKAAAKAK